MPAFIAAFLLFGMAVLGLKTRDKVLTGRLQQEMALLPDETNASVPLIWNVVLDGQLMRFQFICTAESAAIHINGPRFRLSLPARGWNSLRWQESGTLGRLTYRISDDHDREKSIHLPLVIFRSTAGKQALWWLRQQAS